MICECLHYSQSKANLLSTFFSRIYIKLMEIAIVEFVAILSTHTFMTRLIGFISIYCFSDDLPWNLIIALSIATLQCGSYTSENFWERWSITGCTLPRRSLPGTWLSSRNKGIVVNKVEMSWKWSQEMQSATGKQWKTGSLFQ